MGCVHRPVHNTPAHALPDSPPFPVGLQLKGQAPIHHSPQPPCGTAMSSSSSNVPLFTSKQGTTPCCCTRQAPSTLSVPICAPPYLQLASEQLSTWRASLPSSLPTAETDAGTAVMRAHTLPGWNPQVRAHMHLYTPGFCAGTYTKHALPYNPRAPFAQWRHHKHYNTTHKLCKLNGNTTSITIQLTSSANSMETPQAQ